MLFFADSEGKKQADQDEDRAKGRAHFVCHVFVAETYSLQLRLLFVVILGKGKIDHFLGDVSHKDPYYGLLEVLHFPCLDVYIEGLPFLVHLQMLLIKRLLQLLRRRTVRQIK